MVHPSGALLLDGGLGEAELSRLLRHAGGAERPTLFTGVSDPADVEDDHDHDAGDTFESDSPFAGGGGEEDMEATQAFDPEYAPEEGDDGSDEEEAAGEKVRAAAAKAQSSAGRRERPDWNSAGRTRAEFSDEDLQIGGRVVVPLHPQTRLY